MDEIYVGGSLWSYKDYLVEAYSRADVFVEEPFDVMHTPGLNDDGCELVACAVKDGRVEVL